MALSAFLHKCCCCQDWHGGRYKVIMLLQAKYMVLSEESAGDIISDASCVFTRWCFYNKIECLLSERRNQRLLTAKAFINWWESDILLWHNNMSLDDLWEMKWNMAGGCCDRDRPMISAFTWTNKSAQMFRSGMKMPVLVEDVCMRKLCCFMCECCNNGFHSSSIISCFSFCSFSFFAH